MLVIMSLVLIVTALLTLIIAVEVSETEEGS